MGDGYEFDLGGRVIKVLRAKVAHCNSSLFFYDADNNMLFAGDEFESGQTLMFLGKPNTLKARLKNMRENAERLYALCDEHTLVLPNHNGAPIAKEYLLDYIGLVDSILKGEAEIEDVRLVAALFVPFPVGLARSNLFGDDDGGFARRFFVFWILRVFERGGDVFGDVQTLEDLEDQRLVFRTTRRVERGLAHLDLRR